jgi:DNA-binding CsgD family transcriptional regulator
MVRAGMAAIELFTAELMERAQTARDLSELRQGALDRIQQIVPGDTMHWVAGPDYSTRAQAVHVTPEVVAQRAFARYRQNPQSYNMMSAMRAVEAMGGVAIDTDIVPARDRERLPLYTEILRPSGVRTFLACNAVFRGQMTSAIALCRHGQGARFDTADVERMRPVTRALGLVEVAFMARTSNAPPEEAQLLADLSTREAEVAQMLARGLQNKEIAALLGTSPDTVRKQTIRIYEKMHVEGRVQLLARFGRLLSSATA